MKLNDAIDMQGRLSLQKRDASDRVIGEVMVDNSIVLGGRDMVAKLFVNEPIGPISHVAVGTGTTPVDADNDTSLEAELFRKAIDAVDPTQDMVTTEDGRRKVTLSAELDFAEANGALTEAGLFNSTADGVMYNRVVFPAVNKTTDFKLTLLWEVTF